MSGEAQGAGGSRLVERGYDRMAEGYLGSKDPADPIVLSELEGLVRHTPAGAPVLDLGCGAGVPATRWLAGRGFAVTGVDISHRQLELARHYAPAARLIKADMAEVEFPAGQFAAVVSLYAIIHVPREKHAPLLRRIAEWLGPGGLFLATWPLDEWEGKEENWEGWGAAMWWSHYDSDTYKRLLEEAGFSILSARVREDKESWLWVLARK